MDLRTIICALLAVFCLITVGWIGLLRTEVGLLQDELAAAEATPPPAPTLPAVTAPPPVQKPQTEIAKPSDPDPFGNRERILELEEIVAGKDRVIKRLQDDLLETRQIAQRQTPPAQPEQQEGRRGSFGSYMERLRDEDPERYQQMQERMRNFAVSLEERAVQQSDFVAELDLTKLAAERPEDYAKLQDGLARLKELAADMKAAQENEEQVPREVRREMFTLMRDMQPMLEEVRYTALKDLAGQLGYREETSGELVDYIQYIYEMTSVHGVRGGGRGR